MLRASLPLWFRVLLLLGALCIYCIYKNFFGFTGLPKEQKKTKPHTLPQNFTTTTLNIYSNTNNRLSFFYIEPRRKIEQFNNKTTLLNPFFKKTPKTKRTATNHRINTSKKGTDTNYRISTAKNKRTATNHRINTSKKGTDTNYRIDRKSVV